MSATNVKQGTGKELKSLFAMLTGSIGESLGSLVGREIVVRNLEPDLLEVDILVARLQKPHAVARGIMEKGFVGKLLYALFEVPDAVAMAAHLMMTPENVIAERRSRGTLEGEDAEGFNELCTVLFSGFGNVLREKVGNIDIRMQDHGVLKPGGDRKLLGSEPVVAFGFRIKVGEHPESTGYLVVDRNTAEAWNKAPLEAAGAAQAASPSAGGGISPKDDEALEAIPAAPICGMLAAFVIQPEVFRILRLSCRRVGFDLRRHGRGEIPNPAAHKNEVVLLDVPPGEDRRFDWCRRIKELSSSTKVVLLIHQPSRQRVAQAFMSRADVILGFPCEEAQLSQKLSSVLQREPGSPST